MCVFYNKAAKEISCPRPNDGFVIVTNGSTYVWHVLVSVRFLRGITIKNKTLMRKKKEEKKWSKEKGKLKQNINERNEKKRNYNNNYTFYFIIYRYKYKWYKSKVCEKWWFFVIYMRFIFVLSLFVRLFHVCSNINT